VGCRSGSAVCDQFRTCYEDLVSGRLIHPSSYVTRLLTELCRERQRTGNVIPPGMSLLSDEERLATLALLEQRLQETLSDLARLPLVQRTQSAVRRKEAMEAKLVELESAIAVFMKPKVYISA